MLGAQSDGHVREDMIHWSIDITFQLGGYAKKLQQIVS